MSLILPLCHERKLDHGRAGEAIFRERRGKESAMQVPNANPPLINHSFGLVVWFRTENSEAHEVSSPRAAAMLSCGRKQETDVCRSTRTRAPGRKSEQKEEKDENKTKTYLPRSVYMYVLF